MSTPVKSSADPGAPSGPDETLPITLTPGTIIAERYRIDSLLGEGGMGKVYAARHVHIQTQVAIKVLHQEMSTTPEYVARFEREAVAAAKIAHPNVAAATDFGRLPNRSFYLVLEYVAGADLRTITNGGPLSKERAVRIVRQIALAAGAAHAVGIIHRDLKPENVMVVDRDGDPDFVKVLDFGIAKFDAQDSVGATAASSAAQPPLTKIGAVFGTPDYMSPEQALGQVIDLRADLYSIGVIFHELLTGERLFKGGAVTLMRSHVLEEAPRLPPTIAQAVGPRFEGVILRLLQKSPDDRYASTAELVAALDAASGEESGSMPAKTTALPMVPRAEQEESAALPSRIDPIPEPDLTRAPSSESIDGVQPKKRGFLGLTLLMLAVSGGGFLYYFFGPQEVVGWFSSDLSQATSALLASPPPGASAGPRSSQPAEAPVAPAWSATSVPEASLAVSPSDSTATTPDEAPLPTDTDSAPASSIDAAAAPHPSAAHVTPSKPSSSTSKPVHKPTKPSSPAKHPGS